MSRLGTTALFKGLSNCATLLLHIESKIWVKSGSKTGSEFARRRSKLKFFYSYDTLPIDRKSDKTLLRQLMTAFPHQLPTATILYYPRGARTGFRAVGNRRAYQKYCVNPKRPTVVLDALGAITTPTLKAKGICKAESSDSNRIKKHCEVENSKIPNTIPLTKKSRPLCFLLFMIFLISPLLIIMNCLLQLFITISCQHFRSMLPTSKNLCSQHPRTYVANKSILCVQHSGSIPPTKNWYCA